MKILFAASEVYPLTKTGGLADVAYSLPAALCQAGHDIRIVMPAYHAPRQRILAAAAVGRVELPGGPVALYELTLPGSVALVWLVDAPALYDRPGNPYTAPDGAPWPDNAERFAVFSRAVTAIARNQAGLAWQPDILHCNDWQSALAPALLAQEPQRPATVFTIHNLAYQGIFPYEAFVALGLPDALWSHHALEFYGRVSFIKGGLAFADRITTVSPTYAQEILTPELGEGLDGLLRSRQADLSGILNGIDVNQWDPARDGHLAYPYDANSLPEKARNKRALQLQLGLRPDAQTPLLATIGRMAGQKGIDLLIEALPGFMDQGLQAVILGTGEHQYETALQALAECYPNRLAVTVGFDEALAHRIEAGADLFVMPSRFEPCGLNQLYSMRYGTLPLVRRTGGLIDTVVDATAETLANGTATGFVFDEATAAALDRTLARALALFRAPANWQRLQQTAMQQDYSWARRAGEYLDLYQSSRRGGYAE